MCVVSIQVIVYAECWDLQKASRSWSKLLLASDDHDRLLGFWRSIEVRGAVMELKARINRR